MKTIAVQILMFLRQRPSRRNVVVLSRFVLVLAAMITLYSVIFMHLMRLEGQSHTWIDAFYWALVTMSTLGYGDIVFQSQAGRLFSMFVLFSGTVFLLAMLPFMFIQFFYAPWMDAQARARAPRKVPDTLSGHAILTHPGPLSASLIARLSRYRYPYVLIVPDIEQALRFHDEGVHVLVGDLDDPDTFARARASAAQVVTATGEDTLNANVVFTVREIAPNVPIISTARESASEQILTIAGSTHVLRLGELTGESLARRTIGGDAITHVIGSLDKLMIAEASALRTPLVGRTLRENRLTELGVSVVGVWERGRFEIAGPDTLVGPNTVLVLAGSREQLDVYDEHFAIYNVSGEPVIIIGGGRVGRAAAKALTSRGISHRIIERDASRTDGSDKYIVGNAAEQSVLERAGIGKAPAVLVTTHDDSTNIYLTILLRHLRPDIQIISRSTLERNVATLHRAGADFVMSSSSMGANMVMNLLKRANVLMVAEGLNVVRLPMPPALAGKRLAETSVRKDTGCTVIAVCVGDDMRINPDPNEPLPAGADIMIIGTLDAEDRFLDAYGAGQR